MTRLILLFLLSSSILNANPLMRVTQVARSVPFDNGTNGFTADNTQDAIEEAISGQAGKIVGIPTFLNNGATKNKWLSRDGSFDPSNSVPAVIIFDAQIFALSYSNSNDNSSADAEIYKNGVLLYTWEIRSKRTAWKTNMPMLSLTRGDRLSVFFKDVAGNTPNSVFLTVDIVATNNVMGEGGTTGLP